MPYENVNYILIRHLSCCIGNFVFYTTKPSGLLSASGARLATTEAERRLHTARKRKMVADATTLRRENVRSTFFHILVAWRIRILRSPFKECLLVNFPVHLPLNLSHGLHLRSLRQENLPLHILFLPSAAFPDR